MEKNYKLLNGNYLHFHETDDGYDYTIYDSNGNLLDGGVLVDSSKDYRVNEILKKLWGFTGIKELNSNNLQELDGRLIEEFEQKQLNLF